MPQLVHDCGRVKLAALHPLVERMAFLNEGGNDEYRRQDTQRHTDRQGGQRRDVLMAVPAFDQALVQRVEQQADYAGPEHRAKEGFEQIEKQQGDDDQQQQKRTLFEFGLHGLGLLPWKSLIGAEKPAALEALIATAASQPEA